VFHRFLWKRFRGYAAGTLLAAASLAAAQHAHGQAGAVPPAATPAAMVVPLDTPTTLDLSPFVSGSGLTGVAVRAAPGHGVAAENGLSVTYTPGAGYFGPDSFTYVVFGALGASAPATVTIEVVGRPDPARDAAVAGLLDAQNRAARRFADAQVEGIHRRMETLHRPDPVADGSRAFGPWASGSARFGTVDSSADRSGGRFSGEAITLGVDRRFSAGFAGGVAAGFARDDSRIGDGAARSKARGASVAGYGSWRLGPNAHADALLGYGKLELDSTRQVAPLEASAAAGRDGWQLFGSIAGTYEWRRDNLLVAPYGRLDFLHGELDSVAESAAGRYSLAYAAQDLRASHGAIGARVESRHEIEHGVATPRVRAEYRRELGGERSAEVAYAEGPATRYALGAGGVSRNALLIGIGADLVLRAGLRVGFDYTAQRVSGQSNTQGVRVTISQDLDALADWGADPLPFRYPVSVDFGFAYDDNVSRSAQERDRLWDQVFSVSGTVMRLWPLGSNARAQATAIFSGEKLERWQGLGRFSGGVQAELQYRTSAAFDAPTYAIVARALYDQYESGLRTGPRYFAGINARRAVTDRIELFGEVGVNARYGRSDVFRLHDTAVKVNVDYALTRKATMYLTGEYRQGDTVSSGPPSLAAGVAEVVVPDDAFEPLGYIAYRVDARTLLGTLGVNYPMGPRDSVDFSWRRVEAKARRSLEPSAGDLRYVDNLYSLVYLMRF
jgi:outer membrane autotransporter protein